MGLLLLLEGGGLLWEGLLLLLLRHGLQRGRRRECGRGLLDVGAWRAQRIRRPHREGAAVSRASRNGAPAICVHRGGTSSNRWAG